MAQEAKSRRLCSSIFLSLLASGFILASYIASTGEDPTSFLMTLGVVSFCFLLELKFPKRLSYPKTKRDTLTEFTNITKQNATLAGFHDDSVLGFESDYNINSVNEIRGKLRLEIAAEGGWKRIRRKFTKSVRDAFGTQWYAENRFLLRVLDLEEYLGFEGAILDILKGIQSCSRIEELEKLVIAQLIPDLRDQIESGGNTTFLDVDKMKDEESARLVPIILEKRREHFLSAMDRYRASEREVHDLSDVLGTNYGFRIAKAIKKEIGSPKAAGYVVTQLDSVYETLMQNQSSEETSVIGRRPTTRWIRLCEEIAMAQVSRLIDVKFDVPFQYCNLNLRLLYESGFRDIFKVLKEMQSYPKLYKGEYKFILELLKGIKTDRALDTLELLKQKEWKEKYLQS